ncbi:MAG: hypothetical protein M1837_006334 [Sclerophora amabilis]|nr:MAG: hypothetical protein M1837_006334 [Sclerophora amabilis]
MDVQSIILSPDHPADDFEASLPDAVRESLGFWTSNSNNSGGRVSILACLSHANNVSLAVQAAQTAFLELSSKHFVVIGYFQGGGSAWTCAQQQAILHLHAYLGAVAVAPVTTVLAKTLPVLVVAVVPGISAMFPEFNRKDILTPDGEQRLDLVVQIGAGIASTLTLLIGVQLLQANWRENPFVQIYERLTNNGGKEIAGRLLVIQGESVPRLRVVVAIGVVNRTVDHSPNT